MSPKPNFSQVSSLHSTMKVAVSGVELVGVRPHPAVLGLLEDEGEGVVEFLVGAEPDELAFAHVDVGLEDFGEGRARAREFRPSAATTRSCVSM